MKRILTWAQPTSSQLHIGNYFGAIKPMLEFQDQADTQMYFFVADLHALTKFHGGAQIRENAMRLFKIYMAVGIDPKKTMMWLQSSILEHTQLMWILSCHTVIGFMERMHAYKDALEKNETKNFTMGSFNYPILQAADILLYDINFVPVGSDQKQHIEFARDIAQKMNHQYGEILVVPQPFIQQETGVIPWLDGRKMSKSYNNFIGLLDSPEQVEKLVKRIPTDTKWVDESKNPDEDAVYNILKNFLGEKENADLRTRYEKGGLSYKDAKVYLADEINKFLAPIQQRFNAISDEEVHAILANHHAQLVEQARKRLAVISKAVWF